MPLVPWFGRANLLSAARQNAVVRRRLVGFFRITDPDHEKPRDDGTSNWQDYQNKMSLSILNSHQLPWFKIVYDSANSRHEIRTTKTETDYETEPCDGCVLRCKLRCKLRWVKASF